MSKPNAKQLAANNNIMRKNATPKLLYAKRSRLFDLLFHICHKTTTEAECPLCAEAEELRLAIRAADQPGEKQYQGE